MTDRQRFIRNAKPIAIGLLIGATGTAAAGALTFAFPASIAAGAAYATGAITGTIGGAFALAGRTIDERRQVKYLTTVK